MRFETHGAPVYPPHPGAGDFTGTARSTEGSRLLASGRLGAVLVAAATAAVAQHAERLARDAGIPSTLDRGDQP